MKEDPPFNRELLLLLLEAAAVLAHPSTAAYGTKERNLLVERLLEAVKQTVLS